MRKAIKVNIPEPCQEDWHRMSPRDKGRHCSACNKTVMDFTSQTDEKIVKTLTNTEQICGRFKTSQLNREMVLARKDKNNYLSLVASGVLAFMTLGSQDILAQGSPKTVKIDSLKTPKVKGKIAQSILKEKVVTGLVTTAEDGLPLPGAAVIVKGTSRGAQTDFDGKYSIKVSVGEILEFLYVGHIDSQVIIGSSNEYDVVLEQNSDLDDVHVVGGYINYTPVYTNHCNMVYDEPELVASRAEQEKSRQIREQNRKWKKRNKDRRTQWKAQRIANRKAIRNGEKERTVLGKFFYGIKSLFSKK